MTARRYFQLYGVILVLAGVAYFFQKAVALTDGTFFYTLDDPYIHLSLAENIRAGHYGINVGEVASPSSSMIYPFLLAGLMLFGAGSWGPLILNLIGAAGMAWIFAGLLFDAFADNEGQLTRPDPIILLPFSFLAIHAFGLPLNGMEYTLHVWVSLAIVAGLLALDRQERVPVMLVIAIIAAPLLRFEGAALAFAAIAVLAWQHRFPAALVATLAIIACFAGYATLMSSLGLPMLPSSVLTKQETAAALLDDSATGPLYSIFVELFYDLQEAPPTHFLIAIGLILFALASAAQRSRAEIGAALAVAAGAAAHVVFGDFGILGRYDIYMLAALIGILFVLYRPYLSGQSPVPGIRLAATCLVLITIGFSNVVYLLQSTVASRNVHAQQYQMHRFSTEFYDGPVAANDIGYISYQNDAYLLDLWGLGSEEARAMLADGVRSEEELDAITQARGIHYAMVFDEWFPGEIPENWCKVASLDTSSIARAFLPVVFYLIDLDQVDPFRATVAEFEPTLPPFAELTISPPCAP